MANKFTQSVLQRLEQEQKIQSKAKARTKKGEKDLESQIVPKQIKKKESEVFTDVDLEKTNETDSISGDDIKNQNIKRDILSVPDISDYLRLEPTRSAKNKTFYLDVEVIDALCAAARRQNVTDSKLCNDILRRVLGVGKTH